MMSRLLSAVRRWEWRRRVDLRPRPQTTNLPTMLFFRHFHRFRGGHLKIWDYYQHVLASGRYKARIVFSPQSTWDDSNPWAFDQIEKPTRWVGGMPGAFFLGAYDWDWLPRRYRERSPVPVLNLIQHVDHAKRRGRRYEALRRPAIRICVGKPVADAIQATGQVRGPVHVIQNGVDTTALATFRQAERTTDLLIVATKNPGLGLRIGQQLSGHAETIQVHAHYLPRRADFLHILGQAKTTLFLPDRREGFYLPALEAMAMGCVTAIPDVVGSQAFARNGYNCLQPEFTEAGLIAAAKDLLAMGEQERTRLVAAGYDTARLHDLELERSLVIQLLLNVEQQWRDLH